MESKPLLVRLPPVLKKKLDALRATGTTANGLIRYLLETHFNTLTKKGR